MWGWYDWQGRNLVVILRQRQKLMIVEFGLMDGWK